ncbi:hypothetical protein BGZ89_003663 [Linnemannia elongata]|nr:hypothetical protein BGZ89_003663 [Linnemannia elongata]
MSLNLPRLHQLSVSDMFQSHLDSLHSNVEMDMQPKNAFYVADLGECNPDPMVVRLLAALGAGFDCASMSEIRMMVELGVNPEKIVHANPCKETTQVKYARANNVRMSTFDNEDELLKIKDLFPESKLLLRILVDDSRSHGQFGRGPVLEVSRDLGLDVVGVSFHVGSGCFDATAFGDAVVRARRVFDMAKSYGYDFKLLDVGGGFPSAYGSSEISFESIAEILGSSVNRLFEPEIRVIAEPGRYYVSSAFSLATQVIARRIISSSPMATVDDKRVKKKSRKCSSNPGPSPSTNANANANATITRMYYVNDGVYGSFSGIYYDNLICDPHALLLDNQFVYNKPPVMETCLGNHVTSVWGPTMDSADCLKREAVLPLMNTGDWIYFDNMGAYTVAAASHFHGFMKSEVLYTTTEPEVLRLLKLD